jgi:hypothetical protein
VCAAADDRQFGQCVARNFHPPRGRGSGGDVPEPGFDFEALDGLVEVVQIY